MSKKPYFEDKAHAQYIRNQYCCVCGGVDYIDEKGNPVVTVSHITKKGMGGAHHGKKYEYNNLTPMCLRCHRSYETLPKEEREKYRHIAQHFTYMFFDE